MQGKRFLQFLFAIIITCAIAACKQPVGNIGGSEGGLAFWTVPNRVMYDYNDTFMRNSDFEAFVFNRGSVQSVPPDQLKIGIAENPERPEDLSIVLPGENYALDKKGRKLVVVQYEGEQAKYSIEVRDPFDLGGGGGTGSGSGQGVDIKWWSD